ncbi:MAG TPA: arginine--tRNA ligase [Gammaproteobacteria bacterium]|nr:arginine--tRNA ligase [Gammaproteobacteria bacterium]
MKSLVDKTLSKALDALRAEGALRDDGKVTAQVERSRDELHGDFASPVALSLARFMKRKPREIAEQIVARLPQVEGISKVEIAGPGFINFFLERSARQSVLDTVLRHGAAFGSSDTGAGEAVQVEFVSATPTGPLHVGHGRGAAYGAALANLLEAAGFSVQREYYVNDAGRQMDILAVSVWLRYLELFGETAPFPASAYQGEYIRTIASGLRDQHGESFLVDAARIIEDLPADEADGGNKEIFVDAVIAQMRRLLGKDEFRLVLSAGLNALLEDIRADLEEFGVGFDRWYSERSLLESGAIERAVETLRKADHAYDKDGAVWFKSTSFGDDKDRVIIRENGVPTYFASDIAYHMEKFERGFSRIIDVWGADHHGYVARVKGALAALGKDPGAFEVPIVQMVHLYRGGEKAFMSTRKGEFVTLRELRREVGNDAARFFYIMRRCEQHLDFDLDLAKSQSNDNPVYYLQYAHARICSVLRQAEERGYEIDTAAEDVESALLLEAQEQELLTALSRFPEVVEAAALAREPHQIAFYLREVANDFHAYYNAHQFLVDDEALRTARLALNRATRQVLANGLDLLGVSAPEAM